jgi:hypothetical protein
MSPAPSLCQDAISLGLQQVEAIFRWLRPLQAFSHIFAALALLYIFFNGISNHYPVLRTNAAGDSDQG